MSFLTLVAAAILLSVSCADAAARPIQGYMTFIYDPQSQYLLMETTSKCYITPLTREEKDHVHSNQGIEDIELTYVREWLGALNETLVFHNDPNLPALFATQCKSRDILFLNRKLPATATAQSIFG